MTPAQHFHECGPFCRHVVHCPDCADVYGMCAAHRGDPDSGIRWAPGSVTLTAEELSQVKEALTEAIGSHLNLYLGTFPNGDPEADVVRKQLRAALAILDSKVKR